MAQDCVEFSVRVTEYPGTPREKKRWISPIRKWTEIEDEALVIRMRRIPTMSERQRIQDRLEDIGGGPKKWLERGVSERELWQDCLARYSRALWPDGRPEVDSEEEEVAQGRLLESAWALDESAPAEALKHLRRRNLQTALMARWPILVEKPPKGWESLDNLPDDPPGLLEMLVTAHEDAVAAAEAAEGN